MSLKEVLKANGCTDEQIASVEAGMKEAGIYTASEENLDQKYADLKKEHEKFQGAKIDDGSKDAQIETLKKENESLKYQRAVDKVLTANHVKNPEYISYLISQKGVALKEDGTLDGIDGVITELKKEQPEFFGSDMPSNVRRVELKQWQKGNDTSKEVKTGSLKDAIAEKLNGGNE